MLAIERRNEILARLQEEKKVVVSDLSQLYKVTEETIRRDLEKLENEGLAKKTYGGAVLNDSLNVDLPYTVRKKANVEEKQYIASLVADMISDGDHLILDASSTALYIAKKIKDRKNITIITNSVEMMLELSDQPSWNILSTGGKLKEGSLAFVGYQAERMINSYHVDMAVISGKGIDPEMGLTDSNESDVQIKKVILSAAKKKILALDHTKFDKISFTKVCKLSDIDMIVTDIEPSVSWKKYFTEANVEIKY